MGISVDLWEFLWIYGNFCGFMGISVDLWEFLWIYGNFCGFMGISVDLWEFLWIYGNFCGFMGISVDLWEFLWGYGVFGFKKKCMEFALWSVVRICDMERSPCYKNSTSSSMGRGFHSYVRLPVTGNKKCWVYPSTSSHLVAGILPPDTIHPFRWAQFDGPKKPRNPPVSHHQYRFHLALP